MKKYTFLIDFDNTCAFEEFPNVGNNVPGSIECLNLIQNAGHDIVLWTCRKDETLNIAVNWFKKHNIKLAAINDFTPSQKQRQVYIDYGSPRKVLGDFIIDDKNFGCPKKIYTNNNKQYDCVDWFEIKKLLINNKLIKNA